MTASLNKVAKAAVLAVIGLMLLCGGIGVASTLLLRSALNQQSAASDLLRNHMTADMMHDAIRADVFALMMARDEKDSAGRSETLRDLEEHTGGLKRAVEVDTQYRDSDSVSAATGKLVAPMEAYIAGARRIAEANDGSGLGNFLTLFHSLEDSMSQATDTIEAHSDEAAAHASRLGMIAITLVILAMCVAIAGTMVGGRMVDRHLVSPLIALAQAMRALAAGDRQTAISSADRRDELGSLATAMADFRDQLRAADRATDDQAKLIVDSIGGGLTALAQGNLTYRIETTLAPPFTALRDNFNEALKNLRDLIGAVSDSASVIRSGSGEIAQASEDLARRTEGNAASLEQTAASITQMDGRLRASAAAASQTVERADQATATVGEGRTVADNAVQAMSRVSESAKGIDSVIEGLDKIAFQTRVLAMNAAVEAGRAGDAGRGFAVVADLVSALAMRAEEEAKRARAQLSVTQTEIVTAVEAVTKVDGALANISEDVAQVHALLDTMAGDNRAQSAAITQISVAIGAMDQSTQQNAAMVEQTSAAARNLASEVGSLTNSTARFVIARGATSATSAAIAKKAPILNAAPALAGADDWNNF